MAPGVSLYENRGLTPETRLVSADQEYIKLPVDWDNSGSSSEPALTLEVYGQAVPPDEGQGETPGGTTQTSEEISFTRILNGGLFHSLTDYICRKLECFFFKKTMFNVTQNSSFNHTCN